MIPFLLIGALVATTAVVVCAFWDEIKEALKVAFEKVKKIVRAAIVGATTAIQKKSLSEGLKVFNKFYHKNDQGKWQETVVTKTITEDDLPEHIRRKLDAAHGKEVDISDELEHALAG